MRSVILRSHVGPDGILRLQVPVEFTDRELEVIMVYQPLPCQDTSSSELGWPPSFFERTAGTIPDLEGPPQGEAEARESFDE